MPKEWLSLETQSPGTHQMLWGQQGFSLSDLRRSQSRSWFDGAGPSTPTFLGSLQVRGDPRSLEICLKTIHHPVIAYVIYSHRWASIHDLSSIFHHSKFYPMIVIPHPSSHSKRGSGTCEPEAVSIAAPQDPGWVAGWGWVFYLLVCQVCMHMWKPEESFAFPQAPSFFIP